MHHDVRLLHGDHAKAAGTAIMHAARASVSAAAAIRHGRIRAGHPGLHKGPLVLFRLVK